MQVRSDNNGNWQKSIALLLQSRAALIRSDDNDNTNRRCTLFLQSSALKTRKV